MLANFARRFQGYPPRGDPRQRYSVKPKCAREAITYPTRRCLSATCATGTRGKSNHGKIDRLDLREHGHPVHARSLQLAASPLIRCITVNLGKPASPHWRHRCRSERKDAEWSGGRPIGSPLYLRLRWIISYCVIDWIESIRWAGSHSYSDSLSRQM